MLLPQHYYDIVFSGVPAANLTTKPVPLEGELCPTVVQFTCTIEDLPALNWFINDSNIAMAYVYNNGDTFPITLLSPDGIVISITSAIPSVNSDSFYATSTLTINATILQAFNMQDFTCGSRVTRSAPVTVDFNTLGKQKNNNFSGKEQ